MSSTRERREGKRAGEKKRERERERAVEVVATEELWVLVRRDCSLKTIEQTDETELSKIGLRNNLKMQVNSNRS